MKPGDRQVVMKRPGRDWPGFSREVVRFLSPFSAPHLRSVPIVSTSNLDIRPSGSKL